MRVEIETWDATPLGLGDDCLVPGVGGKKRRQPRASFRRPFGAATLRRFFHSLTTKIFPFHPTNPVPAPPGQYVLAATHVLHPGQYVLAAKRLRTEAQGWARFLRPTLGIQIIAQPTLKGLRNSLIESSDICFSTPSQISHNLPFTSSPPNPPCNKKSERYIYE